MFFVPKTSDGEMHYIVMEARRKRVRVHYLAIHDLGADRKPPPASFADELAMARAENPGCAAFLDAWGGRVLAHPGCDVPYDVPYEVRRWRSFAGAYRENQHVRDCLARWSASAVDLLSDRETFHKWRRFSIPSPWDDAAADAWVADHDRKVGVPSTARRACFKTLGLADRPTIDDVKAAYRRLARANHPDRGGDSAMMAGVNAAYEEAVRIATPHPSEAIRENL